jgi:hypothetical protein
MLVGDAYVWIFVMRIDCVETHYVCLVCPLDVCVASPLVTEVQSLYDGQVFGDAKAGLENLSSTNVHKNVLQEFAHFLICHDFSVLLGNYIHKFGKNALSQKLENNVC